MITISEKEFAELHDRKTFELFINTVVADTIEKSVQQMLMRIPEVVVHHFKQQHYITKTIKDFYDKYPTFSQDENKKTFGQIINIYNAKNPSVGIKDALENTAELVTNSIRAGKPMQVLLEDLSNGTVEI